MDDHEESTGAKLAWSGAYDDARKPHGQGTLTYPPPPQPAADPTDGAEAAEEPLEVQGAVFAGELVHGVREGPGRYMWPHAAAAEGTESGLAGATGGCYEGEYAAGARQGKGSMTYPGGGRYEGKWAAGERSGFGTYWYPGGDMYQGAWRAGQRHGEGTHHCASLEAQYIGEWAAGRFVQGRLVLKDGGWLAISADQAMQHCLYRSAIGLEQTGSLSAAGWHATGGLTSA